MSTEAIAVHVVLRLSLPADRVERAFTDEDAARRFAAEVFDRYVVSVPLDAVEVRDEV